MAEGMSRREWWSVLGGLLSLFGLGQLRKPAATPTPTSTRPPTVLCYDSYLGGYSFPAGGTITYTYDCSGRLLSRSGPSATFTYDAASPPRRLL
jgi:hypothetical protein